jgi:allophanate hydrolase subunit 1
MKDSYTKDREIHSRDIDELPLAEFHTQYFSKCCNLTVKTLRRHIKQKKYPFLTKVQAPGGNIYVRFDKRRVRNQLKDILQS